MSAASANGSGHKFKPGSNSSKHHYQRKPSDYEVPVSPTCSTSSVPSPSTNDLRESRYVSAPKLPQNELEAVEAEGSRVLPSPLQREIISEQYEMEMGGGVVMNPGAGQMSNEYSYVGESETTSPSGYEDIDDEEDHLVNTGVH